MFHALKQVVSHFARCIAGNRAACGGAQRLLELLHLVLCMSAAIAILYISHTRAEYLWLGALGGVALILTPLNSALTVTGPLWPDLICVAVFVAYYKLCIARSRTRSPSGGGHGSG